MSRPILCEPSIGDAATVSATSAVASLPAANLQTMQPSQVWRTQPGTTTASVTWQLAAAALVDTVFLFGCNLSPAGTWQIDVADSDWGLDNDPLATYGPAADPTADTSEPTFVADFVNDIYKVGYTDRGRGVGGFGVTLGHVFADPVRATRVRVTLTDPMNPAGRLEVGRGYVAAAWHAPRGPSIGPGAGGFGTRDDTDLSTSLGGQIFPDARTPRPTVDFTLEAVEKTVALSQALALLRSRGRGRDLMVCLDYEAGAYLRDYTCYGLLRDLSDVGFAQARYWRARFTLEQLA
jgi:hypothetical protein